MSLNSNKSHTFFDSRILVMVNEIDEQKPSYMIRLRFVKRVLPLFDQVQTCQNIDLQIQNHTDGSKPNLYSNQTYKVNFKFSFCLLFS